MSTGAPLEYGQPLYGAKCRRLTSDAKKADHSLSAYHRVLSVSNLSEGFRSGGLELDFSMCSVAGGLIFSGDFVGLPSGSSVWCFVASSACSFVCGLCRFTVSQNLGALWESS